jgi:N-methylhydantoinase A
VAYGKGEALTVTDANVALGRLPADSLLAGRVPLDIDRVMVHLDSLARSMGCSISQAASGIIEVANAAMARALRHISSERGHDPVDFTLLSFGGAGGLHACDLADALQMKRIITPRYPGAFSAIGLAIADVRREYARAIPAETLIVETGVLSSLRTMFNEMELAAAAEMLADGFSRDDWHGERTLNLRYAGQAFDLRIGVEADSTASEAATMFHRTHRERYGHADTKNEIEVVAARFTAIARSRTPRFRTLLPQMPGEPYRSIRLSHGDSWVDAPVYRREDLALHQRVSGPAIVLQPDATTYIKAGWTSVTDEFGNLVIELIVG